MRLIDADELIMRLRCNVLIDVTSEMEKEIEQQPTAYDKEKVIEELQKRRQWYDINENPKNPLDVSECADVREHKGKWMAYDDASRMAD